MNAVKQVPKAEITGRRNLCEWWRTIKKEYTKVFCKTSIIMPEAIDP
jgi:hypothetical protein